MPAQSTSFGCEPSLTYWASGASLLELKSWAMVSGPKAYLVGWCNEKLEGGEYWQGKFVLQTSNGKELGKFSLEAG